VNSIFRIIDVNVNRVSEGLRVIEDVSRFTLNNQKKTELVRNLRHSLRNNLKKFDKQLINARDVESDFGINLTLDTSHNSMQANFKRIQEALRSIEESLKSLHEFSLSKEIEKLRFDSYSLEKLFSKKELPFGLYCITASNLSNNRDTVSVVKAILDGGCKIIQYREKYKSLKEKFIEAESIKKIIDDYEALLIINDHPEIALAVDADGVHIGQDDIPVETVRKIIGNKIIGLSTHSSKQALAAHNSTADYIGVGPIFETKTKDDVCKPVGIEYAEYAKNNCSIPFYAIGGIKEHSIEKILNLGIKRICLVSEITSAIDITKTVQRINTKILEYGVIHE